MKLRFVFFVVLIHVCTSLSMAQVHQGERFEMELKDADEDFLVISAEQQGIFLSRKVKNNETKRDFKYQLIHLDTSLNKVWELYDYVDLEYKKIGYDFIDPYVYFLFNSSLRPKNYRVIRFRKDTQEKEVFDIETNYEIELTEFEVIDETLIFGGYINNRPAFVCYKFGKSNPIVLPGFRNEPDQIMQLEVEEDKGIFNVLLNYQTPDKKRSISIKSYDTDGNLNVNLDLKPQGDYGLLYGRSVSINNNEHIVVGTYTYKKSDYSRGIFVSTIEENGDHVINYYNYADLKNFFNYLKAKREIKIKKKIERRKIKGKKNKFLYKLIVHDIIENNGQYIMVGEAFYPKYSYGSSYYNVYSPYSSSSFFEGYAYTHAVVIGFDKEGKILWDNSFEIQDIVTYNLRHYVHMGPTEDGIILLYIYNNELRSKIIKGTQVLDVQGQEELKTSFDDEQLKKNVKSEIGGLENWYDNRLYAYGIHKVSNLGESNGLGNKEIFFINKISIE